MALQFIRDAVKNKKTILIHCNEGRSRSVTAVIYYFMKQYDLDFDSALSRLLAIYPFADPNPHFVRAIREMQKTTKYPKDIEQLTTIQPAVQAKSR